MWTEKTDQHSRIASVILTTSIEEGITKEWLSKEAQVEETDAEFALNLLRDMDIAIEIDEQYHFDYRILLFITTLNVIDSKSKDEIESMIDELDEKSISSDEQEDLVEYYKCVFNLALDTYETFNTGTEFRSSDEFQELLSKIV